MESGGFFLFDAASLVWLGLGWLRFVLAQLSSAQLGSARRSCATWLHKEAPRPDTLRAIRMSGLGASVGVPAGGCDA